MGINTSEGSFYEHLCKPSSKLLRLKKKKNIFLADFWFVPFQLRVLQHIEVITMRPDILLVFESTMLELTVPQKGLLDKALERMFAKYKGQASAGKPAGGQDAA